MNSVVLNMLLAGVLVLIGASIMWKIQDWRYGEQFAGLAQKQAQDIAKAERWAREVEQRRQKAVEGIRNDAQEHIKAATVNINTADAAGVRLHIAAGELLARSTSCTKATGTADRSASAARAAMVLSDLDRRADQRAGELASAYDRSGIAGLACEPLLRIDSVTIVRC